MFDFIREHQMNIMLALCAVCAMMMVLLLLTRFLPRGRKWILVLVELIATCLLGFDRAAYIYRGEISRQAYVMVRLSNFMVFFLTSATVLAFNIKKDTKAAYSGADWRHGRYADGCGFTFYGTVLLF